MIIWILNHYAISPTSIGGTRHFDLAYELVKKGHTVRIFASSFNHFNKKETIKYDNRVFKEESINNVEFTWIKTPSYYSSFKRLMNIGVFSFRLNRVLNKYLKNETPDIIIGSSVHPLTPLVGIKKAQKADSLFYFEERDLWPQTFIDFGILGERNIITKALFSIERYLYRNSDKVIFLFDKAHHYALSKGLLPNRHIYLPNGFSEDRIYTLVHSDSIEEIISPIKGKKLCVYVGSMGEANHMMPLLELACLMRNQEDYHFLFVGNGALKSTLINFADDKNLENTSFHNSIPKEQIPYLLSQAHCGLISMKDSPLYKWGFSMNKIYDYLSVGLPIIMYSNLENLGELEKSKGIFHSNSVDELKGFLLDNVNIDREFIKKFASEHYSWTVLANRLLLEIKNNLEQKQ